MKLAVYYLALCAVMIFAYRAEAKPFRIVYKGKSVPIIFDQQDAEVVGVAGKALAGDIELITGIHPNLLSMQKPQKPTAIIMGTIGQSAIIDSLVARKKIPKDRLSGKWETFLIKIVEQPFPGMSEALVIAGSDPRGTAFGIFELSKRLGVSPWVYWADVSPAKRPDLSISLDAVVMGPPSVKYRGIFLNDEDWGLKPWAAKNIDTDVKDIGPKTYARIFELMLRLKANYIWPAMHPCTKAFFYHEGNVEVAAQYGIVLGSSHCEPMLRNNVDEWKKNFQKEYGKKPGPWRYDTNKDEIYRYWEDRVKEVIKKRVDSVFTVGMRGIHDGGMSGPRSTKEKVKLLNKVLDDQRTILAEHYRQEPTEVPQIFCPYKEVLRLYQEGAEIPDDVTIVWADDNHGYIRKLSNPDEQNRSGRSGVYYHLSYWGAPEDYLWLSSTSPALISYEMSKAYAYGADRLWVFNVGDIKPAEMETEFAMDLAWDVNAWSPEKAHRYAEQWAARTFGKEFAAEITAIKSEYYRLAAPCKPEHTLKVTFNDVERKQRLADYADVLAKAEALEKRIPKRLHAAYFELILYPVTGAAKMYEKFAYARMGDLKKSQAAYDKIKEITRIYNKVLVGGKWDYMMSMSPRGRPVFKIPKIARKTDRNKHPTIFLNMNNLETNKPMTLKDGVLYGAAATICTQSNGGEARITFDSSYDGKQDLYFLAKTPTANEDSWYVSINGSNKITVNDNVTGGKWEWILAANISLKKGQNTLVISQREPNAKIRDIRFGNQTRKLDKAIKTISLTDLKFNKEKLHLIKGMGIDGESLSWIAFNSPSYADKDADNAPCASIKLQLSKGLCVVKLICVPTRPVHEGRGLRTAISLGSSPTKIVDLYNPSKTKTWYKNVIRGFSTAEASFNVLEDGEVTLKVSLLDPGLAISKIVIH